MTYNDQKKAKSYNDHQRDFEEAADKRRENISIVPSLEKKIANAIGAEPEDRVRLLTKDGEITGLLLGGLNHLGLSSHEQKVKAAAEELAGRDPGPISFNQEETFRILSKSMSPDAAPEAPAPRRVTQPQPQPY